MDRSFSPFVIQALTDTITGGSGQGSDMVEPIGIYRSQTKLVSFFMDCGIDAPFTGSRVPWTRDVLMNAARQYGGEILIKRAIVKVCDPREYLGQPDKAAAVRTRINQVLEPDGLSVVIIGGKAQLVEKSASGLVLEPFINKVAILDFDTVQIEIARALPSLNSDPEDAITAACALVEAVCRSILIELHLPLPARRDIEGCLKSVQDALNLSPGRSDLPSEIEVDVRQILGGLTTVVKGVGALRTHGGDAHGRERGFKRLDGRIARLALNAASSMALFLIETWERQQNRGLPQHADAP